MTANVFQIGVAVEMDQQVSDFFAGRAGIPARAFEWREDVGRRRERTDPFGQGADFRLTIAYFGRVADAFDAQSGRIGAIDRNRVRDGQRVEATLHQIPRAQSVDVQVRTDDQDGRGAALWHPPLRKADYD